MNVEDRQSLKEILLQNWSHVQNRISSSSSLRWKIRGALAALWWASLVFDLEKEQPMIFVFVAIILILGFLYELELKIEEEKIIYSTRNIEKQLNAIAIGDYELVIKNGFNIGTSVSSTSRRFATKSILSFRRWKFWLPYLVIIIFTIIYGSTRFYILLKTISS